MLAGHVEFERAMLISIFAAFEEMPPNAISLTSCSARSLDSQVAMLVKPLSIARVDRVEIIAHDTVAPLISPFWTAIPKKRFTNIKQDVSTQT